MQLDALNELITQNGWLDIPEKIITREGKVINRTEEIWHLPYPIRADAKIDFNKIYDSRIRWCTKRYIQEKLQTTSTHAGFTSFTYLTTEFFKFQSDYSLTDILPTQELRDNLISLIENAISKARAHHRLWALYRPIQWYIWCAENYPELGFCSAYAMELDSMIIPGNPKGEAVRMEDDDKGPLHRTLELPLLINAMKYDKSQKLEHLQQKAAIALSIALGRNPANLTYLRESDLLNLTPENDEPCFIIKMPRIKKRQLNPRDELLDEYLDTEFANYVKELIAANQKINTSVQTEKGWFEIKKPLFIKIRKNSGAVAANLISDSFNMTSEDINNLLKAFVQRHNIKSPLTGELINISPRRLRYTLATSLAAEGISKRELARILDHTDTQHVQVYFEVAGNIVEHLDKASAKGFAKYLDFFKGRIIDNASEAINGERNDKHLSFINETNPIDQTEIGVCGENNICHLDPPFSCYLCPKFQPYRNADHEHVLECLLKSRTERIEKYENARLGIQLDDVIFAVAQVAEKCKSEAPHA
ncbi:MAG: integrase [Gammaproteobacteria bacterium RIFCSPHIGHO2_12_FULL_38_14]|nr:MAG: integrase [Gammaproteobacteria bacterium RIFCSPHIGHO2_12_FULL_38_14]